MNMLAAYGMDTLTVAGSLEAKLSAMQRAGFSQVMLMARDLVSHPGGVAAAVQAVQASGLRPTGFQVLRDFEGLSGHLHEYKVDIAKSMLEMCAALGSKVLLVCSSTSIHASDDRNILAKDLRKLAMLALPLATWGKGALGAACSIAAYGIALWAMTRAPIALVAALRETSVLFGTAIAAMLLHEKFGRMRWIAAGLVVAGAAAMKLG